MAFVTAFDHAQEPRFGGFGAKSVQSVRWCSATERDVVQTGSGNPELQAREVVAIVNPC